MFCAATSTSCLPPTHAEPRHRVDRVVGYGQSPLSNGVVPPWPFASTGPTALTQRTGGGASPAEACVTPRQSPTRMTIASMISLKRTTYSPAACIPWPSCSSSDLSKRGWMRNLVARATVESGGKRERGTHSGCSGCSLLRGPSSVVRSMPTFASSRFRRHHPAQDNEGTSLMPGAKAARELSALSGPGIGRVHGVCEPPAKPL